MNLSTVIVGSAAVTPGYSACIIFGRTQRLYMQIDNMVINGSHLFFSSSQTMNSMQAAPKGVCVSSPHAMFLK
ncbi:MAG: hypothetical protein SVY15_05650 [Halobacteriota archaeon]|nr:hypothetical protein [Halobacteriota archaeon]